jgi:photosystem II stability/assembly factor-like uncharacterized protein
MTSKNKGQVKIKNRILIFSVLVIQSSCRKSNFTLPPLNNLKDSLLNWKEMGKITDSYADDIWFISPSHGFVAGNTIYQSLDSGKNWSVISNVHTGNYFYNLFFVDSVYGFAQGPSELAVTQNGGDSWSIKPLPTSGGLTFFFLNPSTGFYGDNIGGGLFKTVDGGDSWVAVFNDLMQPQGYYPYFLNEDTGYVATASGSFEVTRDGGQTWHLKPGNLSKTMSNTNYNQLQFLDVLTGYYGSSTGVQKTTDGGSTWTNVLSVPGTPVSVIKFLDPSTGYYKSSSAIYKTSDGGQTWTLSCRLANENFIGMYFLDKNTGWACTNGGRIFRIQQ